MEAMGLESMDRIEDSSVDASFIEKLPLSFVKGNLVFPLGKDNGSLRVAIAEPKKLYALDDISRLFSTPVCPVLAPAAEILGAINRFYEKFSGTAQEVVAELNGDSIETIAHQFEEPKDLLELADEAPIIKLLNTLLFQAVKEKASDIHIEPFERHVDVRFRKDGVLYSILSPPKIIQEALISRVKIMAGLDIAEKRMPQDGRIRLLSAGRDVDVRVSIVPTAFGERVVLRLLDRKRGLMELSEIGLMEGQVDVFGTLLKRNDGIILSTGPTGSGKTTTLYAALNRINTSERNVITIEDPIEYQLKGAGQMQVNSKIGLTFAKGLRSILRQDPDVIMVGEIRDIETANMAIQASLTGHLVLSTLHTNDAASAVTRLVDMGIEPFLISSTLTAVIAQRLIRVLCPWCKEEHVPSPNEALLFNDRTPERLWKATGCERCFKTGYQGRAGIFEFMVVDREMRTLILSNRDSATIKEYAISAGMRTLRSDGLEKASTGITSVEEVLRVTHID
ncbi:MAG: type II secretion system ATPase GspE [Deltaproteobacteria bacterium]|nr:type II secretion system ATPase GspE [Deltaproteobacteria bacterium]